uniref:PB1 domain-containing protein n=1 Tax=Kalanchoe fedtschenkoi TaxID=63787 RepID=A0A7N0R8Z2_KALFE
MENYSYGGAASYPDSGDSSPRSREIDFENPPPWEDQSQPSPNYKVKFMCSYGGNITPRPHDNHLSYVGGETKILSVERNTKFAPFVAKLSALCDADVCFKYQLPGEDLDALISVTNDDDLEHMMHEYDRLFRGMAKPARLRLFLFPVNGRNELERAPSTDPKTDRERFVEALNSGHGSIDGSSPPANILPGNNVDFLFAVEKGVAAAGVPIAAPVALLPQQAEIRRDERVIGSDPGEIQRRIQELQRMQIGHDQKQQAAAVYQQQQQQRGDVINSNGNNGNMAQAYGGDFYKLPDQKLQPANLQQGYWQESKQMMQTSGGYPATITAASSLEPSLPPPQQQQQPVYMIPAQGNIYQAPIRTQPAPAPAAQGGFYAVQRDQNQLQQQLYREQQPSPPPPQQHQLQQQQQQQMYNVVTHAPAPKMVQAYPPEMMRQNVNVSGGMTDAGGGGYTQVAYDSSGRQVYYTAPGGIMPPPQQAAYHPQQQPGIVVSSDMRTSSGIGQEGKVVITKVP